MTCEWGRATGRVTRQALRVPRSLVAAAQRSRVRTSALGIPDAFTAHFAAGRSVGCSGRMRCNCTAHARWHMRRASDLATWPWTLQHFELQARPPEPSTEPPNRRRTLRPSGIWTRTRARARCDPVGPVAGWTCIDVCCSQAAAACWRPLAGVWRLALAVGGGSWDGADGVGNSGAVPPGLERSSRSSSCPPAPPCA